MSNFCPQCGAPYQQNAAFCASCSAPRNNSANYTFQQAAQTRNELLDSLAVAYRYFMEKQEQFNQVEKLTMKKNSYKPIKVGILVAGGLLLLLAFVYTISFIVETFFPSLEYPITMLLTNNPAVMWIIFIVVLPYIARQINKQYIRKAKEKDANEIEAAVAEIEDHYNNWPECPVPLVYSTPMAISQLYKVVESGRAYSIKEAINIAIHDAQAQQWTDQQSRVMKNQERILSEVSWNTFFSFFK